MEPILVCKNRKSLYPLRAPSKMFYELPVNGIPFFRFSSVISNLRLPFRIPALVHYDLRTLHPIWEEHFIPNIRLNHSDLPYKGVYELPI